MTIKSNYKAFINAKKVNGAKFGNEAHFVSFAAIIATRNGTEGSNFHIRNTVIVKVSAKGWFASLLVIT